MLTPAARVTEPPSEPAPADIDRDPPRLPAPPLEPAVTTTSPEEPLKESPERKRSPPENPDTVLPLDTDTEPEVNPVWDDEL